MSSPSTPIAQKRNFKRTNDTNESPANLNLKKLKDPIDSFRSSPSGSSNASPSKQKLRSTYVTFVRKTNGEAIAITVEGDGIYTWQQFFISTLNPHQLDMVQPYNATTLQPIPIRGKLMKAVELPENCLKNIYKERDMPTTTKAVIEDLQKNASYIVSVSGKEPGNTKMWVFTVQQYIYFYGIDNHENFETEVCDVIVNFLNEAHIPAHKDVMQNKLINFPKDIKVSDALRIYDEGISFQVVTKDFVVDTNEKVDAFTGIANCIQFWV